MVALDDLELLAFYDVILAKSQLAYPLLFKEDVLLLSSNF
jgi:hypothetical protein